MANVSLLTKKPKKNINRSCFEPGSFSIVPRVYEEELDKKYGIVLGDLKLGEQSGFNGDLEEVVTFRGGIRQPLSDIKNKILKKYKDTPGFCSMKISSKEELMEHVKNIHEVSYCHYVFGKESDMQHTFPNYCCDSSSRNLFLTLMEKGYPNASFFYNKVYNHAYCGLPFVFGKKEEKGFVIIDPTSDQLFHNKEIAPRNNLFISFGEAWKYETDWNYGFDLFPIFSRGNESTFSSLHSLKKLPDSYISKMPYVDLYFEEVFKNPVDVEIKSI